MKCILVIGASRGIGLEVVRQALGRGFAVRAFARSADTMVFSAPNLEKRGGSAVDAEDVVAALAGVDAVVLTLGMRPGLEMLFGPVRLFSAATRVIVQAMEGLSIRRLLCVTGFGAGDSRRAVGCFESIPFQLLLGRAYDDKDVQEQLIHESSLDWVIASPVILTHGPKTGRYQVLDRPETWRNGFISRADVADFLLNQVEGDGWLRTSPVLRGGRQEPTRPAVPMPASTVVLVPRVSAT